MKKIAVLISCFVFAVSASFAQNRYQSYIDYAIKYGDVAVAKMKDFGIPASVTLAQGILESNAGRSELATAANNHFAIKCTSDWTGDKYFKDDDAPQECFRKYPSVADSYKDHSEFLKNRSRYSFLFNYRADDYKAWANGLQDAGYASSPTYAQQLINLIETYELSKYDKMDVKTASAIASTAATVSATKRGTQVAGEINPSATHIVQRINGLKCIVVKNGDSYNSIGQEFNIDPKDLLVYNEVGTDASLKEGNLVYLELKQTKCNGDIDAHRVQQGESMYKISQKYGISVVSLYKLNDMPMGEVPEIGQLLKLK